MVDGRWLVVLLLVGCSSAGQSGDVLSEVAVGDRGGEGQADLVAEVAEAAGEEVVAEPRGCANGLCAAGPDQAPDPASWGPFPVGLRTFQTSLQGYDDVTRKLTVDVIYPATEEARNGPFIEIDLKGWAPPEVQEKLVDVPLEKVTCKSVRDAPIRKQDGPYPLVIFSHGAFGVRYQSPFFTEYLASHGYVIISADHVGNTLYDMILAGGWSIDPLIKSAMNRPLDVTHILNLMLEWNESDISPYQGLIDPERIGMTGHSFGGYTSFAMGFEDPRIKVVVPMSPATQQLIFFDYDLSKFPLPAMIFGGTLDKTLETDKEMAAAFEIMPSPKYYCELLTAGHYTFTDICRMDLEKLGEHEGFGDFEDALSDGCGAENLPVAIAHPLIRRLGIGFLNYHLRQSPGSAQYFAPEGMADYSDILIYKAAP